MDDVKVSETIAPSLYLIFNILNAPLTEIDITDVNSCILENYIEFKFIENNEKNFPIP